MKISDKAHSDEYEDFTMNDAWNLQAVIQEWEQLKKEKQTRGGRKRT